MNQIRRQHVQFRNNYDEKTQYSDASFNVLLEVVAFVEKFYDIFFIFSVYLGAPEKVI